MNADAGQTALVLEPPPSSPLHQSRCDPARPRPRTCAASPWGDLHHRVRCAGPAGLPADALTSDEAATAAEMLAAGLVTRTESTQADGGAVVYHVVPLTVRPESEE